MPIWYSGQVSDCREKTTLANLLLNGFTFALDRIAKKMSLLVTILNLG